MKHYKRKKKTKKIYTILELKNGSVITIGDSKFGTIESVGISLPGKYFSIYEVSPPPAIRNLLRIGEDGTSTITLTENTCIRIPGTEDETIEDPNTDSEERQ